ncbi:mevalonate kinase [Candidatus Bathyarchaeota archaeon]|nr:mevalonate kinase [Candidatus Bathyarchaeota archaeon]
MVVVASAPAKVILLGEHFVVHGAPAIVMAIEKRAYARLRLRTDYKIHIKSNSLNLAGFFVDGKFTAELGDPEEARLKLDPIRCAAEKIMEICGKRKGLNIEIESEIPASSGLGSSAAVAAAVAAAVGAILDVSLSKEDIFQASLEAEKLVHGSPSGVDPAIVTFGGALLYQVNDGIKRLSFDARLPLIIGDTGVERSTKDQVLKVRMFKNKHPRIFELMKKTGREIVLSAVKALMRGDLKTLGELMDLNHALLYGLGVSDDSLERLINAARKAGAAGAKLTGAGGGGCMVALTHMDLTEKVAKAVCEAGGTAFITHKAEEGVRIEHE